MAECAPVAMLQAASNQIANGRVIVVYEPAKVQPRSKAVRVVKWCRIEPRNADAFEPSITHELEITGREYAANNGRHLVGEGGLSVVDPSARGTSEEASQRDLTTS